MKRSIKSVAALTGLAVSLAVSVGVLAPTVASADDNTYTGETYCGTVYSGASPAEDWFAALSDGSNNFYDRLLQNGGGPRELCGPYHWLIEQGAQWVVRSNTPTWMYRGLQAFDAANDASPASGSPQTPARIPAVGPSATYPVSWTDGQGLWLRSGPGGDSSSIVVMPEGTPVRIVCQTRGELISSAYSTTDLWDKVVYVAPNGQSMTAWASDAFINTGTNALVAPTC